MLHYCYHKVILTTFRIQQIYFLKIKSLVLFLFIGIVLCHRELISQENSISCHGCHLGIWHTVPEVISGSV